ncbi:MAG: glycoside hydrolase superfamily [Monoraphidium minutum]|nr:MAG: glycoside hydrolase superfamily [Monoraphidium minutum]
MGRSMLLGLLLLAAGRAAAYEYLVGANAHWMPSSASHNEEGNVDIALDGLQRLGVKLLRTWAFDLNSPSAPGTYADNELMGLDYVVAGAQRRGMRVILALGNFWPAYKGPEHFAADPAVRQLYKDHIAFVLGRANRFTGATPASDPTIYGFDVLNEPRCPGCDAAALSDHISWLTDVTGFTKGLVTSGAMVLAGTEGFFTPQASGHLLSQNPGAGAGCEGEDVIEISQLPAVDAMTAHLYWRHMEQMEQTGWQKPSFEVYINYLDRKLELYSDLAGGMGKPFILEEFGLTGRFFDEEQRKAVFAVVFDHLIRAKRAGRPFVTALFWSAARPGYPDPAGYDIDITQPLTGATVGLGDTPLPAPSGGAGSPSDGGGGGGSSPHSGRRLLARAGGGGGRRMAQLLVTPGTDELDSYRRGPARAACAHSASYSWRFDFPSDRVDAAALLARVASVNVDGILAEAAAKLAG